MKHVNALASKGFTLVELMVVISIISLISSTAVFSTAQARVKAEDAKKVVEIKQVQTAIALHKDTTKKVPLNYSCAGTYCSGGTGDSVALEGSEAFNASMQELVDKGYLSDVPKSRDQSYVYYADPTAQEAAFGAELKSDSASDANNVCTFIPAPYQDCQQTTSSTGVAEPYYTGDDVVNFYSDEGTTQFCRMYGDNRCAAGATGEYASACPVAQPAWFGGGWMCIVPAISITISCQLSPNTSATCSGSGTDHCACIQ